ncbi:GTP pyrophosphokinase [Micromonospora aurantiaca (nom. illeg.)]|uniref:GTP pyrophosphokinase n=1 Tax=Micromonospora aurantiaca (nom. illeg.) TaxID=47850 RepID=UPI001656B398|nr:hypothetical protein [Micromonospora aurantiaca]MBC9006858.1 hypothetical protein [Micromonospora aurantiaca]
MSKVEQSADFPIDEEQLRISFRQKRSLYESLEEEAKFALRSALKRADIKIHSLTSRVKDEDGFLEKVERKQYEAPFEQMPDMVGLRVVCLFLSDLKSVDAVIRETFHAMREEDKVNGGDDASFGYMSLHYECVLGDGYSGPRYDPINQLGFELQCRTIAMDAWANISHHLAYKGEESIPPELRKDFHAISGLLYVADQHFELFFKEARKSGEAALASAEEGDVDHGILTLDSLQAYLNAKYPTRKPANRRLVASIFDEIVDAGYENLSQIDADIERASAAVEEFIRDQLKGDDRLNHVGALRATLSIANDNYLRARRDHIASENPNKLVERYLKYRRLLRD